MIARRSSATPIQSDPVRADSVRQNSRQPSRPIPVEGIVGLQTVEAGIKVDIVRSFNEALSPVRDGRVGAFLCDDCDGAHLGGDSSGRVCFALAARRIAPPHARDDVGVAFKFGNVDFAAPIEPSEAKWAMPCCSPNGYFFVPGPPRLLPIALAVENESVVGTV